MSVGPPQSVATTGRPWACASTQASPNASRRDDRTKTRAASRARRDVGDEAGQFDPRGNPQRKRLRREARPFRAFAENDEPRFPVAQLREGAQQRDEILVGHEPAERDDRLRPRGQGRGGQRIGERIGRGGMIDRAHAPLGNDEAGDEIVTQRRRAPRRSPPSGASSSGVSR